MKKSILLALFTILSFLTYAQDQLVVINDATAPESSFTIEQLVEDVLVSGGCSGVGNFSSQVSGVPTDTQTKSYGYFSDGAAVGFPFEEGIVITTGYAYEGGNIYQPNPAPVVVIPDNDTNIPGDGDIENILAIKNTEDATFVKFDFVPTQNTINFRFIMASEEYDGASECEYTDGFAFLLREVGVANYTNIAVLPDGTPVSVKTINNVFKAGAKCNPTNPAFFAGYGIRDTNYEGRTVVLTATSTVVAGRTYEIKLVIADQGDGNRDSAIFLEAGSFVIGVTFEMEPTCAGGTATVIGDTGGTFVFNPVPTDGAIIDTGTGTITNGTAGTTYTIDYTSAGTCSSTISATVTVTSSGDASFTMTPTCDGGVATITGDIGGEFIFNSEPRDGAVIDQVTGTVTNTAFGTTYSIIYTTSGDCPITAITTVTPLAPDDASFTMTPTCDGGVATITGDTGGTFTFQTIPTDGAIIDGTTGTVTNAVFGTMYFIRYTIGGDCVIIADRAFTPSALGDASFTMTPTCDGGVATITGDTGGTFTFQTIPTDGATIDGTTGTVTNAVFGTMYFIRYTIGGDCVIIADRAFTPSALGDASFTMIPTCDGGTATITGDIGGAFTFDPIPTDGAIIDAITGTVTNGIKETTYTIKYTTPGACGTFTTQNMTLLSGSSSFTLAPTCDGAIVTITGDLGGYFVFFPDPPTDGAMIDRETGEVTGAIFGTTYSVEYNTGSDCEPMFSQTFTPTLSTGDASFTMVPTCDGGTTTITGDTGGVFSFNPVPTDGAIIDPAIGTITNGISGTTYFVDYTISGACSSSSGSSVTVLPSETITLTATPTCDGGTLTITGTAGGIFTFNPVPTDGAIINANTGIITNGIPETTYSIKYTTTGSCSNDATTTVTVLSAGNPSFNMIANCDGAIANVTGDIGGVFRFNPNPTDGALIDAVSGLITNGVSGTIYTIEYTITGPCIASSTQNVTITLPPTLVNPMPLVSCDEDGPGALAFFDLESKTDEISGANLNYTVSYYDTQADADNGLNPLISPYFSVSRTIYVRVQEVLPVCFSTTTLDLQVESLTIATPDPYTICDDAMELDGNASNDSALFDLETQNALVLNGLDPIDYTVNYFVGLDDADAGINILPSLYENRTNPQTLFVRVDNNNTACYAIVVLIIEVNPLPSFDLKDNYTFCVDADGSEVTAPPIIDTGLNTINYNFEWYLDGVIIPRAINSSYIPNQTGTYNVTVTNTLTGCMTSTGDPNTIAEVNESARPLLIANQVSLAFVEANTILATATPVGPLTNGNAFYEFSLDGGEWVSNTPNNGTYNFEGVAPGEHTITARDISGCGIASVTITVLDYPQYFTPNGDGYHDKWNIVGIVNQIDAKIYIFDRYGKLLKQISPTGDGWDGTFNDNLMPTDDYWFRLEYKEPSNGEQEELNAHFTLKR